MKSVRSKRNRDKYNIPIRIRELPVKVVTLVLTRPRRRPSSRLIPSSGHNDHKTIKIISVWYSVVYVTLELTFPHHPAVKQLRTPIIIVIVAPSSAAAAYWEVRQTISLGGKSHTCTTGSNWHLVDGRGIATEPTPEGQSITPPGIRDILS
jgi:hypothetical protein